MRKKEVAIIGLGGVGGYFGFKINHFKPNNLSVSFIARNTTYTQVQQHGLTLLSPEHETSTTQPDHILASIGELQSPDLVFICVKEYDLENVCLQLKDCIHAKTLLFPMMNGADIYDRIRAVLPNHVILPSCVYVASHIKSKGIVEHKGRAGKLIFGKDPKHPNINLEWVIALLDQSGIDYDFSEEPEIAIWSKFLFIASFGLVTARHNSSIGAVCTVTEQQNDARSIMKEIIAIAQKKNIAIAQGAADEVFSKAASFPPETPTSFQLDVNSGKQNTELELFAGAILKFGKQLAIPTPVTQVYYAHLKNTFNL